MKLSLYKAKQKDERKHLIKDIEKPNALSKGHPKKRRTEYIEVISRKKRRKHINDSKEVVEDNSKTSNSIQQNDKKR